METLEDEESTITDDRSKSSFPDEIIEDILSRLPVKSILRFKSVSKISLISAPSFHRLPPYHLFILLRLRYISIHNAADVAAFGFPSLSHRVSRPELQPATNERDEVAVCGFIALWMLLCSGQFA